MEFNQSRLAVFAACERRFYLRYVANRNVPHRRDRLAAAPEQDALRQGTLFHRYMERVAAGLPAPQLIECAPSPLDGWIADAQRFIETLPAGTQQAECTVALSFQDAVLTAKYDLVVLGRDRIVIVDWKTGRRPAAAYALRQRMQHAVFPFVMAEAAAQWYAGMAADDIELVYWFAETPEAPWRFAYSQAEHDANADRLGAMVQSIGARTREEDFPMLEDTPAHRAAACAHCTFMHYCDRGAAPQANTDWAVIFEEADAFDSLDSGSEEEMLAF